MRSKTGSRFTFWLGVGMALRLAMLALNAGGQGQEQGQSNGADFGRFRAIEATQFSGGRVTAGK